MKNRIFAFVLILILALSMTSCGTKTTGSNGKTKITFSFWESSTDKEMETALTTLAEEYNKVNPNVDIVLSSQPVGGYQEWMKAQISSNNMPEIEFNNPSDILEQFKAGLIVSLADELSQPNPYSKSGMGWKDDFVDGKLSAANAFYSENYSVPISGLGLAYFYNKDIYEKLGLTPPKTWEEMLVNFKKVDEAGINPVAFMGQKRDAVDWLAWEICTGLYGNKILGDTNINVDGDSSLSSNEVAKAIDSGYYDITKQGEYQEMYLKYLDMVKEYGKYSKDASGLDEAGAKAQFLSGKAAHIFSGSWDVKSFLMNKDMPFKIGAFASPQFTKESGQYAGGSMAIMSVQPIAVTKSAAKDDSKKAAAIDFVKFITAPENYKTYVEKTFNMPIVKGLDVDPVFIAFSGGTRPPIGLYSMGGTINEYNNYNANLSMLSGESVNMNRLLNNVQKGLAETAKTSMENDGLSKENNYKLDTIKKTSEDYRFIEPVK